MKSNLHLTFQHNSHFLTNKYISLSFIHRRGIAEVIVSNNPSFFHAGFAFRTAMSFQVYITVLILSLWF